MKTISRKFLRKLENPVKKNLDYDEYQNYLKSKLSAKTFPDSLEYHSEVGFPKNLNIPKVIPLKLSKHAQERFWDKYFKRLELPSQVDLSTVNVFEVEEYPAKSGNIIKVVFRMPYDDEDDIVVVAFTDKMQGQAGFVKTVWLNHKKDIHQTLNKWKYYYYNAVSGKSKMASRKFAKVLTVGYIGLPLKEAEIVASLGHLANLSPKIFLDDMKVVEYLKELGFTNEQLIVPWNIRQGVNLFRERRFVDDEVVLEVEVTGDCAVFGPYVLARDPKDCRITLVWYKNVELEPEAFVNYLKTNKIYPSEKNVKVSTRKFADVYLTNDDVGKFNAVKKRCLGDKVCDKCKQVIPTGKELIAIQMPIGYENFRDIKCYHTECWFNHKDEIKEWLEEIAVMMASRKVAVVASRKFAYVNTGEFGEIIFQRIVKMIKEIVKKIIQTNPKISSDMLVSSDKFISAGRNIMQEYQKENLAVGLADILRAEHPDAEIKGDFIELDIRPSFGYSESTEPIKDNKVLSSCSVTVPHSLKELIHQPDFIFNITFDGNATLKQLYELIDESREFILHEVTHLIQFMYWRTAFIDYNTKEKDYWKGLENETKNWEEKLKLYYNQPLEIGGYVTTMAEYLKGKSVTKDNWVEVMKNSGWFGRLRKYMTPKNLHRFIGEVYLKLFEPKDQPEAPEIPPEEWIQGWEGDPAFASRKFNSYEDEIDSFIDGVKKIIKTALMKNR